MQISYEGEIDETSGNTIAGAISAFKATISDGDVLIPEWTTYAYMFDNNTKSLAFLSKNAYNLRWYRLLLSIATG